jgi:hypothetical protein
VYRHPLAIRVDLNGREMIILRLRSRKLNKDRPTRDPLPLPQTRAPPCRGIRTRICPQSGSPNGKR